jgi:hypothetical protein
MRSTPLFFAALPVVLASASAPSLARAADPKIADCLAATEASLTLRSQHKLSAARAQLLICSAASCPGEVRQECAHRIDEVNSAQPTVVFAVRTGAGQELSAVKVSMDGTQVIDHLDGTALPLDPGSHQFSFEAPGQPSWSETLILHEGEKNRREQVVLGGPQPSDGSGGAAGAGDSGKNQRLLAFVSGGAGLAGIVVGSIFGGMTFSSWSSAKSLCAPPYDGCSAAATSDRSNAVTFGTVSTVGFIAGGVLLAGGIALYFTAPKAEKPPPVSIGLRLSPGAFGLAGSF